MQPQENRRRAAQGDFRLIRALSVEINAARLRRYVERLQRQDALRRRARRSPVFARRIKRADQA